MNEGRRKPYKSEIFVKSDQFPIFFDELGTMILLIKFCQA